MNLDKFALKALLSILAALGATPYPAGDTTWKVTSDWNAQADGSYMMVADSSKIVESCKQEPASFIKFPSVVLGAQLLLLDGHEITRFGDPTFKQAQSFYGVPSLRCDQLIGGKALTWEVHSYTKFFARVKYFPRVEKAFPATNLMMETLNVVASGSLLLLALFCFIIFFSFHRLKQLEIH